jgi:hypothetical protein
MYSGIIKLNEWIIRVTKSTLSKVNQPIGTFQASTVFLFLEGTFMFGNSGAQRSYIVRKQKACFVQWSAQNWAAFLGTEGVVYFKLLLAIASQKWS